VSARACRIFLWFWMLGLTSCSFTNPPRRGGPLRPPVLTELFLGTKCCGFTAYPLSAFTKTTGMTTNIHRVLGSRNRGNTLFCLVPDRLTLPVVYASGLHGTRRSARDVGLLDDETRCWQSCRCMKILCVGADRCVRPLLPDFPLVLDVRPQFVFSSKSSVYGRTAVSACPYRETANRVLPVMDISIIMSTHLYRVTYVGHSIVCID